MRRPNMELVEKVKAAILADPNDFNCSFGRRQYAAPRFGHDLITLTITIGECVDPLSIVGMDTFEELDRASKLLGIERSVDGSLFFGRNFWLNETLKAKLFATNMPKKVKTTLTNEELQAPIVCEYIDWFIANYDWIVKHYFGGKRIR